MTVKLTRKPSWNFLATWGTVWRVLLPLLIFGLIANGSLPAQIPGGAPQLTPLPHPEIARPPLPPVPVPWLLVIGGGLFITALVALLLWLLFKLPRKQEPLITPLEKARALFVELKTHLGQMPPDEISHHVSMILRDYLEGKYDLPALTRTTHELFRKKNTALLNSLRDRFCPVADVYDKLSFASQPATREDAAALIESALRALSTERVTDTSVPPPLPAGYVVPPPFAN